MKKNILLTGASGEVGKETLKELVHNGDKYNIIAFDIKTSKSKKILKPFQKTANIIFGDIRDRQVVNQITKNVDFVIHLAAVIPPMADKYPELAESVNVGGTRNLILTLENNSPNAFLLYSSSISVYGDRLQNPMIKVSDQLKSSLGDEYAKTKIKCENLILNSKLNWSIFRFTGIMAAKSYLDPLMFHMPLKTSFEIATTRDTAYAVVQAIEFEKELQKKVFNLSGGEKCRIIYRDFLKIMFEINGFGSLPFLDESFATANFHCGFYQDAKDLDGILHFQRDQLDDYFTMVKDIIKPHQKFLIKLLKPLIVKLMLKKSDPLKAIITKDKALIERFCPELIE